VMVKVTVTSWPTCR